MSNHVSQLQNSPRQQNRPFEPFCHPLGVCARRLGKGPKRPWQTDSKSSIFLERRVLQLAHVLRLSLLLALQGYAAELKLEPSSHYWVTWNGTESCQIDSLFQPSTQEEIITLVQEAFARGKKIKVLGAGHSLNAISKPESEGWTLSLENYAKVLSVDVANQTITVQGGATLNQINQALNQQGLALDNLGSISDQTIGGVIQTGTHGSGQNYGPLHTQILSMTVINGQGELKNISPKSPLFQAYLCGLGTLGIIDTVTLRAVPAFRLHEQTYPAQWPELLDQIDELVQKNDHFRFYWFPYTNLAGVCLANPTTEPIKPHCKDSTSFDRLIEQFQQNNNSIQTLDDVLATGPDDPAVLEFFNRAFFEADYSYGSDRIDRSDLIFNVDCTAHSHCCAMEGAVPLRHAKSLLLDLQNLIGNNRFPAHTGVEVRFVKADSALISPTYSEDPNDLFCFVNMVSIRPHNRPIRHLPYFQGFQKLIEKYQGRLHWGKMGEFNPDYLKRTYPQWERFQTIQKQEDPSGLFLNKHTAKILERS